MKKYIILKLILVVTFLLFMILPGPEARGQVITTNYEATVIETEFGNSVVDGIEINIADSEELVLEAFNEHLDDAFDKELDRVEKGDNTSLYKISEISLKPDEVVDLYLKTHGLEDSSSFHLALAYGYDNFVDLSDSNAYKMELADLSRNLVHQYQKKRLKTLKERLSDRQADLLDSREDLRQSNQRLQKRVDRRYAQINKRLEKIEDRKHEISSNEKDLTRLRNKLHKLEKRIISTELLLDKMN